MGIPPPVPMRMTSGCCKGRLGRCDPRADERFCCFNVRVHHMNMILILRMLEDKVMMKTVARIHVSLMSSSIPRSYLR